MPQFKDEQGRTWDLSAGPVLNVASAKRVKDLRSVDLFKLFSAEAERLFTDPALLVDVLFILCQRQADKAGVSDEQFGEGLVGDALERAANALMDAVADFFPQSKRQTLRAIKEKGQQIGRAIEAQALKAIAAVNPDGFATLTSSAA